MKILVVDDDQSVAFLVGFILEREGYEIVTAADGMEGYSAYLEFQPDLVISDIQMPGKNGFELMQNIRGVNPSVKTIYMSGDLERFYPLIEEEQKNFPINILPKPFKMADLIAKVSDFFSWESSGHGKIFARNSLLSLEERAA